MCGIAGIVNFDGARVDPAILRVMVALLCHRGPDETGSVIHDLVGLGRARLSFIDIAGGRQPMHSPEGDLCITFNGEIFNYVELRDDLIRAGHRFEFISNFGGQPHYAVTN